MTDRHREVQERGEAEEARGIAASDRIDQEDLGELGDRVTEIFEKLGETGHSLTFTVFVWTFMSSYACTHAFVSFL